MIQTFEQIWTELQGATGSYGAAELVNFKRDVSTATNRFKSVLSRPWSRVAKKANVVANQQDYQLPRSVLRPSGIDYLDGSTYIPLVEVSSEKTWSRLNSIPSPSVGTPRFFFVKGKDIISIWPKPSTAVTEGLRVYFEPKQLRMVSGDFNDGTVAVTQGSATITHSAAGFTPAMVGRYFYLTDTDGFEYQIVDYTDSSNLVLENLYEGDSDTGKNFNIGCAPDIPDEYLPSIFDFAYGRHLLRKGDRKAAMDMMALFQAAIDECKEAYASPTSYPNIENIDDMVFNAFDRPPGTLS